MQDGKGKDKKENVTITRRSPLSFASAISVGPVSIHRHFSVMARQEGDPVPFGKEEYSSTMKGQFSLDLRSVGRFSHYNRSGQRNITEKMREIVLADGSCSEVYDTFQSDGKDGFREIIELPLETRIKRATDTLTALGTISGGAMQANNMIDMVPKFIILVTFAAGNHPFGQIISVPTAVISDEEQQGPKALPKAVLNINAIKEVLRDYKDQIVGSVFIGRNEGFLDEYADALKSLPELDQNDYPPVILGSVIQTIKAYNSQLSTQMKES